MACNVHDVPLGSCMKLKGFSVHVCVFPTLGLHAANVLDGGNLLLLWLNQSTRSQPICDIYNLPVHFEPNESPASVVSAWRLLTLFLFPMFPLDYVSLTFRLVGERSPTQPCSRHTLIYLYFRIFSRQSILSLYTR